LIQVVDDRDERFDNHARFELPTVEVSRAMSRTGPPESVHEVPVGPRLAAVLDVTLRLRKQRTIMLVGKTGIGKTEFVRKFCHDRDLELAALDLAAMDPPDLTGLPQIVDGRTHFAVPAWLPTEGRGVLFLDELNRAPLEVQQALYRLVLEGRLHDYRLPPGWVVWAAINPAEGDYQVSELDPALADRFREVRVVAVRETWIDWAKTIGVHPVVLGLVRAHDKIFDRVSPRVWERTSDVLLALSHAELREEERLRDLCSDDLGDEWMQALIDAVRELGPGPVIDPAAVLAGYADDESLRDLVLGFAADGQSDRLATLTSGLAAIVASPELGGMIEREEFDLARFELLVADLHGDMRRQLQTALGNNPRAIGLINVDASNALHRYGRSALATRVAEWTGNEQLEHRALLVATAVAEHLDALADVKPIRRRIAARRDLGVLLRQVGPHRAVRLSEVLKRLRIRVERGAHEQAA
jgi:hypothetical protein